MSFFTDRDVKATRKPHACEGCGKLIAAASPAWYFSQLWDGCFSAGYYHTDCRKAEVELNELKDFRSGDDWLSLCEVRDEPDDIAWLVQDYPVVAARMGLTGGAQ